jgi:hypothetical protein
VDSASQSGGLISWNNVSSLTTSTTNKASKAGTTGTLINDTNTITAHTPEYMDDLDAGITFNALNVKFKAYSGGAGGAAYLYITEGGVKRSEFTFSDLDNTAFRTFAGNAAYWGLAGGEKQIITDLGNGNIKLKFWIDLPPSVAYSVGLEDFQVQLDYTLPDTTRAALLIPLA